MRRQLKQQTAAAAALREEKAEAEATVAVLRQQLETVQEQVAAALRQQLEEAQGTAGKAAEEAEALRQQLGAAEARAAGLEAQLAAAAGEREVLQQRAAALEAEVGAGAEWSASALPSLRSCWALLWVLEGSMRANASEGKAHIARLVLRSTSAIFPSLHMLPVTLPPSNLPLPYPSLAAGGGSLGSAGGG